MPYIDAQYYKDDFEGEIPSTDKELNQYIKRACDNIDILTGFKINMSDKSLEEFHPFIRDSVKKATAMLVEHYVFNGGYEQNTEVSSVSLGNFSYDMTNGGKQKSVAPSNVVSFLSKTGLLYMGIDTEDGAVYYDH